MFYGVAISSVVTLFTVVSRYGMTHLKAPLAIGGNYQLQIEPSQPCPDPPPLQLRIQQSGIFVNGALLAAAPASTPAGTASLSLDGRWRFPQLDLAGRSPTIEVCGRLVNRVAIASTHDGNAFSGQLTFAGLPAPLTFKGQLIPPTPAAEPAAAH
jgi:hypothetical protein